MAIEINKIYSSLVYSDVRYNIVTGGRGSGKSYSVNTILSLMMLEDDRTILFLRKTLTSAHLSIIPEFIDKIKTLGLESLFHVTKTEIFNKSNGSAIYFRGIQSSSGENTANLKSIANVSVVVIDEAEELTDEATFDRIDLSVRKKGVVNKVIIVLNPASKTHWIYTRFFEQAGVNEGHNGVVGNTNYIHTTYLDNLENLDQSFIDSAELMKKNNPTKYKMIMLGGWLPKAEGVIFENWSTGDFVDNGIVLYGCDFGFSVDPTTLTKVCIDKKNKRIYLHECVYRPGLTTSDILSMFKQEAVSRLIVADSAEPRLIEELRRGGLNIKGAVKGQGSVTAGIALMLDYSLIVSPTSVNLIKELNNYVWHDKKSNTPIDAFNHCFTGDTMVSTINGNKPIIDIDTSDYVLTTDGYKKVLKKFNNGVKKVNKYLMQFDTFSVYLCSTDSHLIKTDIGWKEISKLEKGMTVDFNKLSMERHTSCMIQKDTSLVASGGKERKGFMSLFGNSIMGKFPKDFTYTIKTKTFGITISKIWNALRRKNTLKGTNNQSGRDVLPISNCNFLKKSDRSQKNGTRQKPEENGIANMQEDVVSETMTCQKESAQNAENHSSLKTTLQHSAQTNVSQKPGEIQELTILSQNAQHVESFIQGTNIQKVKLVGVHVVESWEEEVFDIMVEDCHEYFANGILVHNCIDGARYAISDLLNGAKFPGGSLAKAMARR